MNSGYFSYDFRQCTTTTPYSLTFLMNFDDDDVIHTALIYINVEEKNKQKLFHILKKNDNISMYFYKILFKNIKFTS